MLARRLVRWRKDLHVKFRLAEGLVESGSTALTDSDETTTTASTADTTTTSTSDALASVGEDGSDTETEVVSNTPDQSAGTIALNAGGSNCPAGTTGGWAPLQVFRYNYGATK